MRMNMRYLVFFLIMVSCNNNSNNKLKVEDSIRNRNDAIETQDIQRTKCQDEFDSLLNNLYAYYDKTFLLALANDTTTKNVITLFKDVPIYEIHHIAYQDSFEIQNEIFHDIKNHITIDYLKEKYNYYHDWCYAFKFITHARNGIGKNKIYDFHQIVYEVDETRFIVLQYADMWESLSYSEIMLVSYDLANYLMDLNEVKRQELYDKFLDCIKLKETKK